MSFADRWGAIGVSANWLRNWSRRYWFIPWFLLLILLDVVRVFVLPPSYQSAFTDIFETVVVAFGAVASGFAVALSSKLTRGLWAMTAAYFALCAAADFHDFLVDVHFSSTAVLSLLEFMGWGTYLPLALLIFFPASEEGRVKWKWMPVIDFTQVAIAIGLVYFRFIYLHHVDLGRGWTYPGTPELVRNILISIGLLLRAMVEPKVRARAVYRIVGGGFAVLVLGILVFGVGTTVQQTIRPAALLAIGICAAYWNDRPGSTERTTRQRNELQFALSVFGAATLVIVLALASDAPIRYRGIIHAIAAASVLLFVLRSSAAEYARYAAARVLRDRDERLRAMFNHQVVGVAITSPEKRWLEMNDTWCQMIGYSREELAGLDWMAVTHPDDRSADAECFRRMVSGEIDQTSHEKRYIRKDGTVLHTEISVDCVCRPDGSPAYFVGLVTDVSARKQAEAA